MTTATTNLSAGDLLVLYSAFMLAVTKPFQEEKYLLTNDLPRGKLLKLSEQAIAEWITHALNREERVHLSTQQ